MQRVGVVGNPGSWSTELLADAFEAETGFRHVVDMSSASLDLETGSLVHEGLDLASLDALVVKKIGPSYSPEMEDRLAMLQLIEARGTRVYSRPEAILSALNRLACTVRLRAGGVPMPPTTVTEDPKMAEKAVREYGRAVLKPLYTSKARGMEVIDSGDDLRERLLRFRSGGNPVMYVQKLMDAPGRDLGLAFLAGSYIGTYARRSGGAWNTSTAAGGRYEAHEPPGAIIDLASRAQALFGLDFTCVDVMETGDGPVVLEVSAFGGFRGLKEACDLDAASLLARHVLRKCGHETG